MQVKQKKFLYFCYYLNNLIKKNINRFKDNISIICDIKYCEKNEFNLKEIVNFCKTKRIPIFFSSYRDAILYKGHGIFIRSSQRKARFYNIINKKLKIIGIAHNQKEYFEKINQGCTTILLSPVFMNNKFSQNKLLGTLKFNLMKLNWTYETGALGGITKKNLRKSKLLNTNILSFSRLMNEQ